MSNLFLLIVITFATSCKLNNPLIETSVIQPNLLKEGGLITEFLSASINATDRDGPQDIVSCLLEISEEGLSWVIPKADAKGSTFASSFIQGPSANMPHGRYIFTISDAAGHVVRQVWQWPQLDTDPQKLLFPYQHNWPAIEEEIYLFIYKDEKFLAEYLIDKSAPMPDLLDEETAYLYYFNKTVGYGLLSRAGEEEL